MWTVSRLLAHAVSPLPVSLPSEKVGFDPIHGKRCQGFSVLTSFGATRDCDWDVTEAQERRSVNFSGGHKDKSAIQKCGVSVIGRDEKDEIFRFSIISVCRLLEPFHFLSNTKCTQNKPRSTSYISLMSIFCCTSLQTTKKTKEQTTKKNLNHKQAATFPPPGIIHQSKVSLSRGTTEETELHYLVWHLQRQQLLLHLSEPVVVCLVRGWAFIKLLQHLSTLCELMCFSKCIPCRWWKLFLWCDESTAEQVTNADV